MTNVLLIDQFGNRATKNYVGDELGELISCIGNGKCSQIDSLPQDEGLNESECYKVNVRVSNV